VKRGILGAGGRRVNLAAPAGGCTRTGPQARGRVQGTPMKTDQLAARLLPMLLLACSFPALADITRGCSASVGVFVMDKKADPYTILGTIQARAGCKNKIHADDCRRLARAQIDRCIVDLWNGRNDNALPVSCNSLAEGSSRPGARLEYDGILIIKEPQRLTSRAAAVVCCHMRPKTDRVMVSFEGRINGDQACASTRIGKDSYQDEYGMPVKYDMKCAEWRAKGICG